MPRPPMRDPPSRSTASRFSDRVPSTNPDGSRSGVNQIPSASANNTNETPSHNGPARKDITPPSSSSQVPMMEQSSKSQRGFSKSGGDSRLSSDQSSIIPPPQVSRLESPPDLAHRMSSEKPPRLRKYPSASPIVSTSDKEPRGGQAGADQSSSSMNSASEDLKDRLDRPTLLDRLQAPAPEHESQTPSLRDRLVPSKRDRDELLLEEGHSRDISYDNEDGNDNKRARRRSGKGRRGGGGGGGRRNAS